MNDADLDCLVDAGTALLGISIEQEWKYAIRMHLAVSLRHADTVLAFDLPDDADPAPVFHA